MKASKDILKKANIYPRLRLFTKTPRGLKSTGKHIIKLLLDKEVEGTEYRTGNKIEKVRYLVEENGEKKIYERNKYNKSGDVDYLVVKLSEFEEGTEIVIEGSRAGMKNVVNISSVTDGHEVEVEDGEEDESDVSVKEEEIIG